MDITTPPSSSPAPPHAPAGSASRAETLEQVMRLVEDDLSVIGFLAAEPASSSAAAALGRLLAEHPVRLVDRCPVVSFATGRPVDPRWRDWYPARPNSLWALLEFHRGLYGAVTAPDPLAELEQLRERAALELGR